MTKYYVTSRKIAKYRTVTRERSSGNTWRDRAWTNVLATCKFFFGCVHRVRATALDWRSDSEVYRHEPVTESVYIRAQTRVCIRVTGVACEGARVVRKHVRLIRATETNWNHTPRASAVRSEVYRRNGNYLWEYICLLYAESIYISR